MIVPFTCKNKAWILLCVVLCDSVIPDEKCKNKIIQNLLGIMFLVNLNNFMIGDSNLFIQRLFKLLFIHGINFIKLLDTLKYSH